MIYLSFTLLSLITFSICLYDTYKLNKNKILIISLFFYGILLEYISMKMFDFYSYPTEEFIINILNVPISIGLIWAVILYNGIKLGEGLNLEDKDIPIFVGLFVLNIDLAMDAIAIKIPFWEWEINGLWFGVPIANFLGWYLVGLTFTLFYVLFKMSSLKHYLKNLVYSLIFLFVFLNLWIIPVNIFGYWIGKVLVPGLFVFSILYLLIKYKQNIVEFINKKDFTSNNFEKEFISFYTIDLIHLYFIVLIIRYNFNILLFIISVFMFILYTLFRSGVTKKKL